MKSRGVYETPGGAILQEAHRDVEGLCLDRDVLALKESLVPRWARLVYSGYWHSREMECLNALMVETQRHATGSSTLRVCRGAVMAISRRSAHGLHDQRLSSMNDDAGGV
jgi:argininosuccinate synthase